MVRFTGDSNEQHEVGVMVVLRNVESQCSELSDAFQEWALASSKSSRRIEHCPSRFFQPVHIVSLNISSGRGQFLGLSRRSGRG